MTPSRLPQQPKRSSLPLMAAATAALPAVMLSSLALAQPAQAQSPARTMPAKLDAAIKAQAAAAKSLIPASAVPAAFPKALRPAMQAAPADYTVVQGDTVTAIAGKFGLNTGEVLSLNNLTANSLIYPGQKIKLTGQPAAPSPAAPAATPAQAPAGGSSYTVRSGDTLSGIAGKHGVSLSELLEWNQLSPTKFIHPGQQIKVSGQAQAPASSSPAAAPAPAAPAPAAPAVSPAPAGGTSYTVRSGDTLSGIAGKHGVSLSELLEWNQLSPTKLIHPGQQIKVSGSGSAVAPLQPAASVAPLVPSTFLGFEYPAAVVSSANENKALLNAVPVPSRDEMRAIVTNTARSMGVDPALAMAFAHQESGFNQRAVSPANAIGTMQVIPSSGEWASDIVGRRLNLLDPHDNATAGVAIIGRLIATSDGLENAIAGYYQGQYSVSKNGMYDDTKDYVAAILAHRKNFQ